MKFEHKSVMLHKAVEMMNLQEGSVVVDCTLGGGGHSSLLLEHIGRCGRLFSFDQDIESITYCMDKFKGVDNIKIIHDNFSNIRDRLKDFGIEELDGVIMDLGVSSHQFDSGDRGFSYNYDAILDMRMNSSQSLSALEIVNEYSEEDLARIIYEYSDEKWAKRIANFIASERKEKQIKTTFDLVNIIKKAVPKDVRREGPHPAKRTFQAIRIAVNDEIGVLQRVLLDIVDLLRPGGRLSIITFHSLEDRVVKNFLRDTSSPCKCPKELPMCICNEKPKIKIITRKPLEPSTEEINENRRARSSKLRIGERI